MKRYLFAALMATVLVGFSSCKKDDDEDNKKNVAEQAVGTYNVTINYYFEENKKLSNSGMEAEKTEAVVSLDGENLKIVIDDETISAVNIKEASNGFTFDVASLTITEDGESYTMTGYKGFLLGDNTGCDGAYIAVNNKLEFYYEIPRENFYEEFVAEMLSDEEWVKSCIEEKGYASIEEINEFASKYVKETYAKYKFVMDFECTKK